MRSRTCGRRLQGGSRAEHACCKFDTTGKTAGLRPPTGGRCPALRAKTIIFPIDRIYDLSKPPRPDTRDVRPIVTTRGADAMDTLGAQAMRIEVEVKSRGCGPPTLGSSPWTCVSASRPRRRHRGRWRLASPVLRREREVSRKPLRRECRTVSAYLCDLRASFLHLHASQWVRRATGIPCALSFDEGDVSQKPGRISAAGMRSRGFDLRAAHPSRRGLTAAPLDERRMRTGPRPAW
jgi:hypothetical protein